MGELQRFKQICVKVEVHLHVTTVIILRRNHSTFIYTIVFHLHDEYFEAGVGTSSAKLWLALVRVGNMLQTIHDALLFWDFAWLLQHQSPGFSPLLAVTLIGLFLVIFIYWLGLCTLRCLGACSLSDFFFLTLFSS